MPIKQDTGAIVVLFDPPSFFPQQFVDLRIRIKEDEFMGIGLEEVPPVFSPFDEIKVALT